VLQEVTDIIDKVAVAMDLVRTELKRCTARVTVTLTVSSYAQQEKDGHDHCQQAQPDQNQSALSSDQPHDQQDFTQDELDDRQSSHMFEQQQHVVFVDLLSDNYRDVMSQTVREVDKELKLARQLLRQCKESFNCLVSFYGENAQAFANDAVFWSDVIVFVEKFTACQRHLRKQIQVLLILK